MKIGLIDVDGHNFPNIALMKISAYHKSRGDDVEWCVPLLHYDIVYQSKVFDDTYSNDIEFTPQADKIIKGGTVYCLCNYDTSMEENLYRIYTLRDMNYDPYVMIYDKPNAPQEIKHLQRWCNNKIIFRTVSKFEDYKNKGV